MTEYHCAGCTSTGSDRNTFISLPKHNSSALFFQLEIQSVCILSFVGNKVATYYLKNSSSLQHIALYKLDSKLLTLTLQYKNVKPVILSVTESVCDCRQSDCPV